MVDREFKYMEKFKDLLDKILMPFREEYLQKCRNDSVIGGFDSYVKDQLEKALQVCPARSDVRKNIESLLKKFSSYRFILPRERAVLLKEAHKTITAVKNSFPFPPAESDLNTDKGAIKKAVLEKIKSGAPSGKISLENPVTNIPSVGPMLGGVLNRAGIVKIKDLLFYFPRDYQDRRKMTPIGCVEPGKFHVISGKIGRVIFRNIRRNLNLTKADIYDNTGSISLVWFNQPYIKRRIKAGARYVVSGKVEHKFRQLQISSPEIEEIEDGDPTDGCIVPVYPLTEGISQKFMRKIIKSAMERYAGFIPDALPEYLRNKLGLIPAPDAVKKIHFPSEPSDVDSAYYRLRFEEAFFLQLALASYRRRFRRTRRAASYDFNQELLSDFRSKLPFRLTCAQERVISEIMEDLASPSPMNRLLQGDVGSGKTIICIFCVLLAVRSGFQAAVMAPTEVLAEQHYFNFKSMLSCFGVETALLIGATPEGEKKVIKQRLASGNLPVVVGTHAIIQEDVQFKHLSFAVIDEQHKFGVAQRSVLKDKGRGADFLFTTATPIPRSLCLTIYGDLDVSVLNEIPEGRQPINTMIVSSGEKERVYNFIEKEIRKGGRAYIICPLIEESEIIDATPLLSEFDSVRSRFPWVSVSLLHGRMKSADKERAMKDFSEGVSQILVSTTVVEVGVDVPEATVMVILDAHRYGLGQLHQLRGRVGRGREKSYCILMGNPECEDAAERLQIIQKSNSGFEIAEADLRLRGPGEFMGVRQSGFFEFRFIDLARDFKLLTDAREEALKLEKEDPDFSKNEHSGIREKLYDKYKKIQDIIH